MHSDCPRFSWHPRSADDADVATTGRRTRERKQRRNRAIETLKVHPGRGDAHTYAITPTHALTPWHCSDRPAAMPFWPTKPSTKTSTRRCARGAGLALHIVPNVGTLSPRHLIVSFRSRFPPSSFPSPCTPFLATQVDGDDYANIRQQRLADADFLVRQDVLWRHLAPLCLRLNLRHLAANQVDDGTGDFAGYYDDGRDLFEDDDMLDGESLAAKRGEAP